MWFYTISGERFGPVSESTLQALYQQGTVTPQTLVWREGMTDWQALEQTSLAAAFQVPLPEGDAWQLCAYSGERCRRSEMLDVAGHLVSPDYKDEAVDYLHQGGVLPRGFVPMTASTGRMPDLGVQMGQAWRLLVPSLQYGALLYLGILVPLQIATQIFVQTKVKFVPDQTSPPEIPPSFWLLFLGTVILGAFVHGALYALFAKTSGQQPPSLRQALSIGFQRLPSMIMMFVIKGVIIGFGCCMLLVPGMIMIVKLMFCEALVIEGKLGGTASVERSWAMTEGRVVELGARLLLVYLLCLAPGMFVGFVAGIVNGASPESELTLTSYVFMGARALCELPLLYLHAFVFSCYRELQGLARKPLQ